MKVNQLILSILLPGIVILGCNQAPKPLADNQATSKPALKLIAQTFNLWFLLSTRYLQRYFYRQ